MPHERMGHAAPPVVRVDGQRGDLGVAVFRACHGVAGDSAAYFGHYEVTAAVGIQFEEILERPRFGAETGALDLNDPRKVAQTEGDDLDGVRQTALAVERPQSMWIIWPVILRE
jgi:hypothetical protein